MMIFDPIQSGLSKLQTLPIIGPIVFSPAKIMVSVAQMIAGFATGIIAGVIATTLDRLGLHNRNLTNESYSIAFNGFKGAVFGFVSVFYACGNMATLGMLGQFVELTPCLKLS